MNSEIILFLTQNFSKSVWNPFNIFSLLSFIELLIFLIIGPPYPYGVVIS